MKVAIIGSGISGLTIARYLREELDVTIYEKSRGVGGRIATRRSDPFIFDHGAQYFLIKNKEFEEFVSPYIKSGLIKRWDANFKEIKDYKVIASRKWNSSFPHYVGTPTMNHFCKVLSEDLDIRKNAKILKAVKSDKGWNLFNDQGGESECFDWLITTVPSVQANEIMPKSVSFFDKISSINMSACFTLMLGFETDLNLPFESAMIHNDYISWISVNSSKPDRPKDFSMVVQSTNRWANKNLSVSRDVVLKKMIDEASKVADRDLGEAVHIDLHGWRYANAPKRDLSTFIDHNNRISACGDWCMHGRVESAFLSGRETAKKILELIKIN
jgi:hypothetical protein